MHTNFTEPQQIVFTHDAKENLIKINFNNKLQVHYDLQQKGLVKLIINDYSIVYSSYENKNTGYFYQLASFITYSINISSLEEKDASTLKEQLRVVRALFNEDDEYNPYHLKGYNYCESVKDVNLNILLYNNSFYCLSFHNHKNGVAKAKPHLLYLKDYYKKDTSVIFQEISKEQFFELEKFYHNPTSFLTKIYNEWDNYIEKPLDNYPGFQDNLLILI